MHLGIRRKPDILPHFEFNCVSCGQLCHLMPSPLKHAPLLTSAMAFFLLLLVAAAIYLVKVHLHHVDPTAG